MSRAWEGIAVVTGGGSGIGRAICLYLGARECTVIVADRDLETAQETAALVTGDGGRAEAVQLDVTDPEQVQALVENACRTHGRIDYLFNNAGVSVNGEFQDTPPEAFRRVMEVNFWGVLHGCRAAYPIMMRQGSGHIVNTASLAGLIPGGLTTCYSASKHAVVGFSLTLRSEARQYGIRVTALCPGYMRTNIQKTTQNVSAYLGSPANRKMGERMKFPTPEDCIRQMMRGIRRNRGIVVSPARHRLYWWLHRLAPEFIPSMFQRIIGMMKRQARG